MDRIQRFLARAAGAAVLAGVCGIALAGPLEPPGGPVAPTMKTLAEVEARTPIHQSDLPLTISNDGSFYLAEDLYANQNGVDMITILANSVSLDLNGFTIHGTDGLVVAADCIQIEQDVRTFSLTNGVIRGCGGYGVVTNTPFALTVNVDRVQANQNGSDGMSFGIGSYGVVTRSSFKSNGTRGILLAEGVVRECAAFSNGTIGIQVNFGTINGCVARSNVSFNAFISGAGTIVDSYAP